MLGRASTPAAGGTRSRNGPNVAGALAPRTDAGADRAAVGVEVLRLVLDPAREEGAAEDQQEVGEDGAQQGHLHDAQQPGLEREEGDNDLRDVTCWLKVRKAPL